MNRFWVRFTPLLLESEPLAAGIAGALILLGLWLFGA